MSWEKEPLLAKARLYFERAFAQNREDPLFGLFCAIGLELLARAAIANVSPTLLAEPDHEQQNLLYALNRGSVSKRRSIGAARVLKLCHRLFPEFTGEDITAAGALTGRRNDELHSGDAAFAEYSTQHWISGFYHCCNSLATILGENLDRVLGPEEASIATRVLREAEKEVELLSNVGDGVSQAAILSSRTPSMNRTSRITSAISL